MALPKRLSFYSVLILVLTVTMSFIPVSSAFDVSFRTQNMQVVINGTSTLHDWDMKSDKGVCNVVLALDNANKLIGVSSVNFTIPAESLKSGHSGMDNNTYKALKTSNYKSIEFSVTSAKVTPLSANNYQLNVIGKLTIAGFTKETDLVATAIYHPEDRSFTVSGKKDIKMTDYNVKPPTVMLGTIKTGNDITINFSSKIVR